MGKTGERGKKQKHPPKNDSQILQNNKNKRRIEARKETKTYLSGQREHHYPGGFTLIQQPPLHYQTFTHSHTH